MRKLSKKKQLALGVSGGCSANAQRVTSCRHSSLQNPFGTSRMTSLPLFDNLWSCEKTLFISFEKTGQIQGNALF